jgi:hypothetical protein
VLHQCRCWSCALCTCICLGTTPSAFTRLVHVSVTVEIGWSQHTTLNTCVLSPELPLVTICHFLPVDCSIIDAYVPVSPRYQTVTAPENCKYMQHRFLEDLRLYSTCQPRNQACLYSIWGNPAAIQAHLFVQSDFCKTV